MTQERDAHKTPVLASQLFPELCSAWWLLFNTVPTKESILLLIAHWSLETGGGQSMWNYNLGNAKATVGGATDWCFFKCNEILSQASAAKLLAANPSTVEITKYRPDGTCIVWFKPKHSACCFRSFERLGDGALDYMTLVYKRFHSSWPAVVAGDAAAYCHALKVQKYYTADEAQYTKSVVTIYHNLLKGWTAPVSVPPPTVTVTRPTLNSAVDFGPSPLQVPTEEEQCPVWSAYSAKDNA